MTRNTKADDKLEMVHNFIAWKYRMLLILEENDLEKYVKEEVAEQEGDEAKARHKKNMIREKRFIADSVNDHMIPHVSSLKILKQMFDV